MTRVTQGENCGNSPKNIFVAEYTAGFARGDIEFILGNTTEAITWDQGGEKLSGGCQIFPWSWRAG